ncbi:MAG TPA: response regulator transcription factor [Anaerolineaceae bacterium]|nr:response regulator transcription factor [Anaerolineaceae bacterium]
MENIIRLLIVDDHALFRDGVKALLSVTPDIQVVGEAEDGEGAVRQFKGLAPQVVLMDIHMRGMSGIEATRAILAHDSRAGVIMVTMLEDDASVFAAMRAGARGYVLKGANHQEMLSAIRAVAEGQALFGPAIAARMMRFFQENASLQAGDSQHEPDEAILPEDLSEREREILSLIADGYSNKEIAVRLTLSPHTVRNHITSIFAKLQVADRAQAIRLARRAGSGSK